jgi:hypothetical protein
MHIGYYISGLAHSAFLFWAILGGLFEPKEPPPMDVVNVAVISTAEYAAMIMPDVPPKAEVSLENMPIPSLQVEELPDQPTAEEAVDTMLDPDQMDPSSKPDDVPQTPDPLVVPTPQLEDKLPDMDTPSSETLALLQSPNKIEAPQKADRIAPMAVAPSAPDIQIDEKVQETALPSEIIKPPEQPEPKEIPEPKETAEPEAATEITPEIQKEVPTAPKISLRPKARPAPKPQPKPIAKPEPESNTKDAINAALEAALVDNTSSTQADKSPSGPPLTVSEKDGLRLSVQKCWVVDSGSRAANVTLTISMSMNPDGTVRTDTLALKSSKGGSEGAAKIAFQAARRAILRCQKKGYDLPEEKYDHWQKIEVTFDPKKTRTR